MMEEHVYLAGPIERSPFDTRLKPLDDELMKFPAFADFARSFLGPYDAPRRGGRDGGGNENTGEGEKSEALPPGPRRRPSDLAERAGRCSP